MPINNFAADMQTFNNVSKNVDYFTSEVIINDLPLGARNLLTKGFIQEEICLRSGASVSTRGRFISKTDHAKGPNDRPLYLYIQGSNKQCIESAIQQIDEFMRSEINGVPRSNFNRPNDNNDNNLSVNQMEKLFIGLDNVPGTFDLRSKIIGQGGSNLHYIRTETGAAVTLRGRGSQFIDPQLGHESPEPLHLCIEHNQSEGLIAARQLAVNLIETLIQEIQQIGDNSQNVNISSAQQIINLPPRIMGMSSLSVPPSQQFAAVPQQQQNQNIDQPVMISNNPSDPLQGQIQHIRNQQQIQHVQQLGQPQQQVILQQPPPLGRSPIVPIPPPGLHIPQHPGPMVPPQIVQLPPPPPTAPSSGSVLVVAPPPSQSIYLPPDQGSSSSSGTFSFLQGGVLYHQAPPIQTQAQIGDGLHIISAPSQTTMDNVNISMNSHTQPPQQMIITQVQIDPNNQIVSQGGGEQISHTFQQPVVSQHQKTQYHVIGHVQNTINQDQGNIQAQSLIQNREFPNMDNFTHFTISNQTSVPSSMVLTLPYHITASANTSCTTSLPVSQIQLNTVSQHQNILMTHCEQDSLKQMPRQLINAGHLTQQRICGDRPPMTVQLSNNQIQQGPPGNPPPTMEQIILSQPTNNPNIINQISHIPPNQIINQMPPAQMQGNSYIQANQVMVSQQDLNQLTNNQQMNQLNPITTNKLPPNQIALNQLPPNQLAPPQLPPPQLAPNQLPPNQLPPNQLPPVHLQPNQIMSQEQINHQITLQPPPPIQSQIPRQLVNQPYNQINYDHQPIRQDNQNRNRLNQNVRNRKLIRNKRKNFPWIKNNQEKQKYQHDSPWLKGDGVRTFDYDRKDEDFCSDDFCIDTRPRYQTNENSQSDDNRKSQFRNNQDGDTGQFDNDKNKQNVPTSIGQNNQRSFQHYDNKNDGKSHDAANNRNRHDKGDNDESQLDSGQKRKYDMDSSKWNRSDDRDGQRGNNDADNLHMKRRFEKDNNWSSRCENNQKTSASMELNKNDMGSQKPSCNRSSGAKMFGPNDQTKPDRDTACKWSDQSGELRGDDNEKHKFDVEIPNERDNSMKSEQCTIISQIELNMDKRNELSQSHKLPTSWSTQNSDFKGNLQYAQAGQFHGQNMNNPNFQPNYANSVHMFQSNVPYIVTPPPALPPHTQTQINLQQHGLQFNPPQGNNNHHTPPNMQIVSSMPQSMAQNQIISQNVYPNMQPGIMSKISSHLVSTMPNNTNQNVTFDMTQALMGTISQSMATNQNMPSVMTQPSMQINIQNQSSNMGQILPVSMPQNVITSIGQNMTQNLMPNITQNMAPYMSQSIPTNMSQPVTHHIGQTVTNIIGPSITSSTNQNMAPINQTLTPINQSMAPMINQSMPPNMASMIATNTTNVTHTMPMSLNNGMGQSISLNMQPVMGQMTVNPAMVPQPTNMIHTNVAQSVSNMVPSPVLTPNMAANRTQMNHNVPQQSISMAPPAPAPPSVQTMSSQPSYPYWMG